MFSQRIAHFYQIKTLFLAKSGQKEAVFAENKKMVAIVFFIFGLYGLSADNKYRKLPFLKVGIFVIAAIYLLRGIGELIFEK